MNKGYLTILCLIAVIIFNSNMIGAQEDAGENLCIPTGTIVLKPPVSVEPIRALVDFPHSVHFIYKCQECHHTWNGQSEIKSCAASNCHDQVKPPKKPLKDGSFTKSGIKFYKHAYHDNCRKCHAKLRDENKKLIASGKALEKKLPNAGPKGCIACHPKD